MNTRCMRCKGIIGDQKISQEVAKKQAKVSSLLSEIHATSGLHREWEVIQDPDILEKALASLSDGNETLRLKLEELLGALRERKALQDAIQ